MVNFNPIDEDYIVGWQSDLENTKESILPVCDNSYHKIKENMPHGEEIENLWIYLLVTWLVLETTECQLIKQTLITVILALCNEHGDWPSKFCWD